MKKIASLILGIIMLGLIAGCAQNEEINESMASDAVATTNDDETESLDTSAVEDDDKVYELSVGYVQNDKDPLTQGLYYLADSVAERTNGKVKIEVFPSGLLGDTADVLEQCKTGAAIGLLSDAGRFSDYVPEIGILDAPYLFDTYDEGNKITQSDMFLEWMERLQPEGFRVCSFNWYQGARNYLTVEPVNSLEDAKELKIRTGGSPVWQSTINAFGSKATSLPQNDVYAAIQGKVVEGAEQQVTAVYGLQLFEVAKNYALTNHFQLMTGLVVSEKWFQSLPTEYQQIFLEESVKAGEHASSITLDNVGRMLSEMEEMGLKVVEVDLDEWKQASEVVYQENEGFIEIREQVKKILDK